MGQPKVVFGDKIFLYGQFLDYLYQFGDYEYNAVMGYMTIGGFIVQPIETEIFGASVPGFVADFLTDGSLTPQTPFSEAEMVNVADRLAKQSPFPAGTNIWMPILPLPDGSTHS